MCECGIEIGRDKRRQSLPGCERVFDCMFIEIYGLKQLLRPPSPPPRVIYLLKGCPGAIIGRAKLEQPRG